MANYGTTEFLGDPSQPGWTDQNLVTVAAPNGQSWQVNKLAAPSFAAFVNELARSGYDLKSSGGYNYRNIRGSDRLSQHAFGTAIDINAASNPLGSHQTDLPPDIGAIAAKYGLEWGGNWKSRPDPMHFEWAGPSGGQGPAGMPAPQNSLPPQPMPAYGQQPNTLAPPPQPVNALAQFRLASIDPAAFSVNRLRI